MNRKQSEHILDAYIEMERVEGNEKARQSLREVILDAMSEYRYTTLTSPNIISSPSIPTTSKPIVTC